ncbi:Wzz/FepE/Etk N-terminal domain-containing protein [Bacterioplanoides sp.]|uniref:Wzz/FepE/Etk N-terminal domain-containing protein n=1 Tax=Bacterioplanoides sp. TaxID=2066072 RepID=UPI003B004214
MEVTNNQNERNNEIDLFDLIDDLKDKWYWIAGTVALTVALALVYAFIATPVYKTELVVKEADDVAFLEVNQPALKNVLGNNFLTANKTFKSIRASFLSASVISDFYSLLQQEGNKALMQLIYNDQLSQEQNLKLFVERFSHSDPGNKDSDLFLKVQFELADAELSAQVLNKFAEFVQARYQYKIQNDVALLTATKLADWQIQVDDLRSQYHADKERRILQLADAAGVAESIGQKSPLYRGDRVSVGSLPPLFMMGENALRAELKLLKDRPSELDDSYIGGLSELLRKMQVVESAEIRWGQVVFVVYDQKAVVPLSPIKPRKKLIIALGVVAGLMAGSMFALIAAANVRRRERKKLIKERKLS